MGNVNAGLNLHFMDENFVRPLVNIYYALGKLNLPVSWGNNNKVVSASSRKKMVKHE